MDSSRRALGRWLPYLAVLLAVESIVALTPPFTGTSMGFHTCMGALIHVPEIAILLGLSLAVPIMTSGGPARISCQRLVYGSFLAMSATALGRFIDLDVLPTVPRIWLLLQALGSLLLAIGAPGIWGSAVAREEELASPRPTLAARLSAGVAFSGFALFLTADATLILWKGPTAILGRLSAAAIFSSLVLLAGRGILLWSSILSWRACPNEGVARDRARKIKSLMAYSVLATFGSSILTALFWNADAYDYAWARNRPMLVWHGFVQLTLTLLATILVAGALETPTIPFEPRKRGPVFPEPPPPAVDQGPIDVP